MGALPIYCFCLKARKNPLSNWKLFMYIIEGNIGAGKTTLLKIIEHHFPHIKVVYEPLDSWHNREHGQSLLSNFYNDTPRWAFTMEMFALMCRVKEHIREQKNINQLVVMERSIYSGYYCFALNCYKQGFMNRLEWDIHRQWFNYLVDGTCKKPHGFIYLKTDPESARERAKKRNRSGEESIPLSYFKQINERLEELLVLKQDLIPLLEDIPVLVLDGNQAFDQNPTIQKAFLEKIEAFFLQKHTFFAAKKTTMQHQL